MADRPAPDAATRTGRVRAAPLAASEAGLSGPLIRCGHFVVPPTPFAPMWPAAAANVNPRTRLSHMTEIPPLLGA